MTAEHIKVTPDSERDLVVIEVDRAGFELLERFLSRVQPMPKDNPERLRYAVGRISGAMLLAATLMKWPTKLTWGDNSS